MKYPSRIKNQWDRKTGSVIKTKQKSYYISPKRRYLIWLKYDGRCFECKRLLYMRSHEVTIVPGAVMFTIEHLNPRSKGGGNNDENLAAACVRCNSRKGSKVWTPLTLEKGKP